MRKNLTITRLVLLLTLTIVIEWIGLPQPFTGPFVNMMLLLTTLLLGPWSGVLVGCVTPAVAALRGQLPPPLIPMIPFIVIGNALLVVGFTITRITIAKLTGTLKRSSLVLSQSVGVLLGAAIKFLWLYFSASVAVTIVFGIKLSHAVIAMMAFPQFLTAVLGGILSLVVVRLLRVNLRLNQNPG